MPWNLIKIRWCAISTHQKWRLPSQTNVIPHQKRGSFRAPYTTKGHAGTRQTKDLHHGYFLCLSCPRAALALEQGEFMPRGFLASKDPFSRNVLYVSQSKVWGEDTAENRLVTIVQRSTEVRDKKDFVLEKSCLLEVFGLWGLKPGTGTALISCHDSFHKEKN